MGIVYVATNQINGKQYVGKSLVSLKKRKQSHQNAARNGRRMVFCRALSKYGIDSFTWEILFEDDVGDSVLCRKEMEFITRLNSQLPRGYNMTAGGEGFRGHHTEETKKRLSECNRGKVISENHKRAIGLANRQHRLGTTSSQETKNRIRKAMLGRVLTDEWKKKIGLSNKGKKRRPVSDETRKKLSVARRGKPLTVEHRMNLSKAKKGKIPVEAIVASAAVRRGKKLTEEHKEKCRIASTGKRHSAESLAKMREASMGRKHTEESKVKIVAARKRQVMRPVSKETKEKIRESVRRSWKKRKQEFV